ncbi:MAG: guanylate kinase [Candidatus Geothermincolia bacterium]
MSGRGRLFVVAGPSGAGKTTVIRRALESVDMHLSVSATTRAPRPGEVDGVDYTFITEEEFKRLEEADAFLEWEEVYGNRYGTPRGPVEAAIERGENVLLEIDVKGALAVKCKMPGAFLVFIMPPSEAVLRDRLEGRADGKTEIDKRLEIAPWELEVGARDFDEIIVNDDLEDAVHRLVRVLRGEKA